jgi:hypothetical protein
VGPARPLSGISLVVLLAATVVIYLLGRGVTAWKTIAYVRLAIPLLAFLVWTPLIGTSALSPWVRGVDHAVLTVVAAGVGVVPGAISARVAPKAGFWPRRPDRQEPTCRGSDPLRGTRGSSWAEGWVAVRLESARRSSSRALGRGGERRAECGHGRIRGDQLIQERNARPAKERRDDVLLRRCHFAEILGFSLMPGSESQDYDCSAVYPATRLGAPSRRTASAASLVRPGLAAHPIYLTVCRRSIFAVPSP